MFRWFKVLLICFVILAFVLPVLAQETTPSPTPTPVVTGEQAINITTLIYFTLVAIFTGGGIAMIVQNFGANKAALDTEEKLFLSLPPDAQRRAHEALQAINDAYVKLSEFTDRLLTILNKITDGKPNE